MSEQITQQLGFDASKAITELARLRGELNNFKQSLQSTAGHLRKFPGAATPAIQTLRQITTDARHAASALQTVGANVTIGPLQASSQAAGKAMGTLSTQAKAAGGAIQTAIPAGAKTSTVALRDLTASLRASATGASSSTRAVAGNLAQVSSSAAKTAKSGKELAGEWTASWATMARVVQTQIIVRTLGSVIRALQEGREEAKQFSLAISEALTIAGGKLGDAESLSSEVLELSRAMGVAPLEMTAGLYQTLSNQVVDATDAMQFNAEATKLAITTQTELSTVVNALSSVVNSYNLSVGETDRVSNVLFKTIEHGRLRLEAFGDVIGRVSPLTAALGIRYEEMSAAIAAITQKGVPAHTAITQLTQITQKLLRPTTGLMKLYREWGVETGAQAIQRFGGLAGVLVKMQDATAGNDTEFANLLGTVRAVVGALNLAEGGAESLQAILADMDSDISAANRGFEEMENSAGRRAERAMNDLHVTMTELGKTSLAVTTPMLEAFNSLTKQTQLLQAAFIAAGFGAALLTVKLITLKIATLAAAKAALVATASVSWPLLVAAASAYATLKIIEMGEETQRVIDEQIGAAEEAEKKLVEVSDQATAARIRHIKQEMDERTAITAAYIKQAADAYNEDAAKFADRSKVIQTVAEQTMTSAENSRKKLIKSIQDAVEGADGAIKASTEAIRKSQEEVAETVFQHTLKGLNEVQQAQAHLNRALGTGAQARRALAEAGGNEEEMRIARELAQLALKRTQEARAQAERAGHHRAASQALELELTLQQQIQDAESRHIRERKKLQSTTHREELHNLKELQEEGKQLQETFKELVSPVTSEGLPKPTATLEQDMEQARGVFKDFLQNAREQVESAKLFEEIIDPTELGRLLVETGKAMSQAQIDWSKARDDLAAMIKSREYSATVKLILDDAELRTQLEKVLGPIDEFTAPGAIFDQMDKEARAAAESASDLGIAIGAAADKARGAAGAIGKLLSDQTFLGPLRESLRMIDNLAPTRTTGVTEQKREVAQGMVIEIEKFRLAALKSANALQEAADAGRVLTQEEEKTVEVAGQALEQLKERKLLSEAQVIAAEAATSQLKSGVEALKNMQGLEVIRQGDVDRSARLEERLNGIRAAAELNVDAASRLGDGTDENTRKTRLLEETAEEATRRIEEGRKAFEDSSQAVNPLNTSLKETAANTGEMAQKFPGVRTGLDQAKQGADALANAQKTGVAQTNQLSSSVGGISTGLSQAVTMANSLTAAMNAAAQAAQQAAVASRAAAATGSATAVHGGRYFATGGRGTDQIPAMLSRGEFVMNAKSARQFFPQLQAMNAGVRPTYRDQGGPVTNVGDINVSVNGGETSQKTIREIATGLRRELRRGTIKLS